MDVNKTPNINLVAGFWHCRNDRSEEGYLKNFENILKLNLNITIFISQKHKDFILDKRKDLLDKTQIIFTELSDIKNFYFNAHWDKVQHIRTNPSWFNSTHWLKRVPQHFSEWYNPIVMSKIYMLYETYKQNQFNSDKYIWIDAGLTQHLSPSLITENSITNMGLHIKDILFSSVPYESHEMHGFNYEGFKKYTDTLPKWLCRGGIFGCDKNAIEQFYTEYDYHLKDSLERGYMGTEESIFSLLTCINPDFYQRIHHTGTGIPDLFLKQMQNYNP